MTDTSHQNLHVAVVSGQQDRRARRAPSGLRYHLEHSVIPFLRLIRRVVFQLLMHSLDAFYDLIRYLRYSNSLCRSRRDRQKLESLLYFYYHKIEKALVLPDVKPLFGMGYIGTLLDLMDRWVQLTGDLEAVVFRGACASLVQYQEHVGDLLVQARPELAQRIDSFLAAHYAEPHRDSSLGGTVTVTAESLRQACQGVDLDSFVRLRHSVRDFADRHIPDSAIVKAVELAQQSPSACNRQSWRVHVVTSVADKEKVLQCQNGNRGFGHLADRVLLVTADLRAYITSGERNQAYVDTSMFAMTLVYALQAQGIVSCCLNACTSFLQDIALRRVCRISESETPIMMIAIGYPRDSFRVATSARVPTKSILFFRDLEAEMAASLDG